MSKKSSTDVRLLVREKGLRATPARLAVCEVLRKASAPLTHAEVASLLEERGTDHATVFRNLVDLSQVGLVRRLEVGDHLYRFEWCGTETDYSPHAHFVCVDCGEVTCLPEVPQASISPLRQTARRIIRDVTEVLYKGHCRQCG